MDLSSCEPLLHSKDRPVALEAFKAKCPPPSSRHRTLATMHPLHLHLVYIRQLLKPEFSLPEKQSGIERWWSEQCQSLNAIQVYSDTHSNAVE